MTFFPVIGHAGLGRRSLPFTSDVDRCQMSSISRDKKGRTVCSLQIDTDLPAEPGIGPKLAYPFTAHRYAW